MSPCSRSRKNTKSQEFPKGEPVCPGTQTAFVRSPARRLIPLAGLFALVWFLVRVIPKPSRAAYPCQRAAAPIAAGFVMWLVSVAGSMLVLRKARRFLYESRYLLAVSCLVVGVIAAGWAFFSMPAERAEAALIRLEAPNTPMGTANGIHPGRVVWVHDPNAIAWDGTSGNYWDHTSQTVVDQMLSKTIRNLAGESSDGAAWAAFFRYFNIAHGKGNVGYRTGEKIAIKINANGRHVSEQMALSLLNQLVHHAGVPIDKITYYDIPCKAADPFFGYCRTQFPTLRFVALNTVDNHERRVSDLNALMHWSWGNGRVRIAGDDYATSTHLPTCVTEANYLINLTQLKGHTLAGVTLCGKNWFGSFCSYPDNSTQYLMPKGAGVHPYIAAHAFPQYNLPQRAMGTYNCLVDLMSDPRVGGKTMLNLIDGLLVTKIETAMPDAGCRWQSAPFNNNWTASMFASLDPVAIDSVAVDFILAEPTLTPTWVYGTVDNYLHEAAQADNPPSGTFYDSAATGKRPKSLGVHEHWNNSTQKLYSRNLGTGNGIELVGFSPGGNILPANAIEAKDWGRYD